MTLLDFSGEIPTPVSYTHLDVYKRQELLHQAVASRVVLIWLILSTIVPRMYGDFSYDEKLNIEIVSVE